MQSRPKSPSTTSGAVEGPTDALTPPVFGSYPLAVIPMYPVSEIGTRDGADLRRPAASLTKRGERDAGSLEVWS